MKKDLDTRIKEFVKVMPCFEHGKPRSTICEDQMYCFRQEYCPYKDVNKYQIPKCEKDKYFYDNVILYKKNGNT